MSLTQRLNGRKLLIIHYSLLIINSKSEIPHQVRNDKKTNNKKSRASYDARDFLSGSFVVAGVGAQEPLRLTLAPRVRMNNE